MTTSTKFDPAAKPQRTPFSFRYEVRLGGANPEYRSIAAERAIVVAIDIHKLHPAIDHELASPSWSLMTPSPAVARNLFAVTNQARDGVRFYRLLQ
jgi:hypothetical protein